MDKLGFNKSKHKNFCNQAKNVFSAQQANIRKCDQEDLYINREKLIIKYSHLVRGVVSRLPISGMKDMDRDDLIGYGTVGLIEAVDRFDPTRNVCFESYAAARIRGAVYDQLRANDMLSRGSRKRVKTLGVAISKLENELGRIPTDEEVSQEMKITKEELRSIKQESQIGVFSLDESKDSSEDNCPMIDQISSGDISFQDKMEEDELIQALAKAIDCLPERERTIIGLYHFNKLTFKEIANIMDFSESRASQIHAKAITLLKERMTKIP